MPRYYFDLHNGDGPEKDIVGVELESRLQISREAARILTDIARDEFPLGEGRGIVTLKIRDEGGTVISVGSVTFSNEFLD